MANEIILEAIISYQSGSETIGGKERKRLMISTEDSLSKVTRNIIDFLGIKEEAKKRGLGDCINVILGRVEKGSSSSKIFTFTTEQGWQLECKEFVRDKAALLQGR